MLEDSTKVLGVYKFLTGLRYGVGLLPGSMVVVRGVSGYRVFVFVIFALFCGTNARVIENDCRGISMCLGTLLRKQFQ